MIVQLRRGINALDNGSRSLCVLVPFAQFARVIFTELCLAANVFVQVIEATNDVAK